MSTQVDYNALAALLEAIHNTDSLREAIWSESPTGAASPKLFWLTAAAAGAMPPAFAMAAERQLFAKLNITSECRVEFRYKLNNDVGYVTITNADRVLVYPEHADAFGSERGFGFTLADLEQLVQDIERIILEVQND